MCNCSQNCSRCPCKCLLTKLFTAGQLAEGHLCFTSTAAPSTEVEDTESDEGNEVRGELDLNKVYDDDLQIIDGHEEDVEIAGANGQGEAAVDATSAGQGEAAANARNGGQGQVAANARNGGQGQVAANARNASRGNPKNSPKKKSTDGIVGVMERFVQIKEKEAEKEGKQTFTITRCMEALKSLEGVTSDDKIAASEVFDSDHNREFFLNLVEDKDGSAIRWLRRQISRLP